MNPNGKKILTWAGVGAVILTTGYFTFKGARFGMNMKELADEVIVRAGLNFKKSTFVPKQGLLLVPAAKITNPTPHQITVRKPTIQIGYSLDNGKNVTFISNSPISSTKKVIAAYSDTDFGDFPILIPYSTLGMIAFKKGGYAYSVLKNGYELGEKLVLSLISAKKKADNSSSSSENSEQTQIYDEVLNMQQVVVSGTTEENEEHEVWEYVNNFRAIKPLEGIGTTANADAQSYLNLLKNHGVSLYYKYDYDVYIAGRRISQKTGWQKI